jgi:hypothetical protein
MPDDLAESSITVPSGAEYVWGLREAMDRRGAVGGQPSAVSGR